MAALLLLLNNQLNVNRMKVFVQRFKTYPNDVERFDEHSLVDTGFTWPGHEPSEVL